ncbi:hypothetical protein RvY_17689 [Ramazzottius varieornatus]|uniref:Small-subunit processome Utp12 domain-containing protein n=1 Tax=Ramazzottius varieornatus TaxID=947166 RepID=A0A1D1W9V3_RAMVA|nr:hypothetical protein RvY_17689 [Ramazzottius varieornatus]
MGLTKQYLRYVPDGVLNFLASQRSNIAAIQGEAEFKGRNRTRPHWVCFACSEIIYVWDIRRNETVFRFSSVQANVTCLVFVKNEKLLAASYADGSLAVYNLLTEELVFSQKAHKSAATCVAFSPDGSLLATASSDTEVYIWDVVGQTSVCRLKGHKAPITDCKFMDSHPYLITSSKDALLKVWDLQTYRCCATLVGHHNEVCKFVLLGDARLITGSVDAEIRVYDLSFADGVHSMEVVAGEKVETITDNAEGGIQASSSVRWKYVGSLIRSGKERIVTMIVDTTRSYLALHGAERELECIRINSEEKVKELRDKRAKKKRKKMKKESAIEELPELFEENDEQLSPSELMELQFTKLPPVRCGGKIASVAFLHRNHELPNVLVNLGNTFTILKVDPTNNCLVESSSVALPAHKFDIRTCAVTADGETIVTTCSEMLRVWNREEKQCVHTLSCDYGVSSVLVPGDRYLVLGTKSGKLQLFDIVEGTMLTSIAAHVGTVWSVALFHETKKKMISGGEDKEVKFWDLEFGSGEDAESKMTLTCRKTLKMDESVSSIKLSPDQRLLAVALLDSTVKIMLSDTLKFFLSLYGHALPVTCMDISSDSRLIITGSADKNVKIWGLDFGDCHKSLFAHDDGVTSVLFIPRTHMFFSAGRDGKIKQWDGDKFERITTLSGHHSEVWSLAMTPTGGTLVSTSHDRTIRLWAKTDEILVLDEERETEREQEFEKQANQTDEPVIAGEVNKEIGVAGKATYQTMQAAERLIEALNIVRQDKEQRTQGIKEPHPVLVAMGNISPEANLLDTLRRIKPNEVQGALLSLSLTDVIDMVPVLKQLLLDSQQTELVMKCLTFLLKVNALQIESGGLLLSELDELRTRGVERVNDLRRLVNFNRAGLENLQARIEERDEVRLFSDATQQFSEKKKKKKNRAILTLAS